LPSLHFRRPAAPPLAHWCTLSRLAPCTCASETFADPYTEHGYYYQGATGDNLIADKLDVNSAAYYALDTYVAVDGSKMQRIVTVPLAAVTY
jgi:hypothetical protein